MSDLVSVQEAELHLSTLLERVRWGEEIVLAENGKPIARLVPIVEQPPRRAPGSAAGQFVVPADFNDPLPDDILDSFEQ